MDGLRAPRAGRARVKGLILAGGKSSRFGSDKALALHKGKSFLERAVGLLRSVDLKPIIITRRGTDYSFLDAVVIYDQLPEKGPLGGIYSAMTVFKRTPFLILTCDMPALVPDVLSGLLYAHRTEDRITLCSSRDRGPQPFPGIYEPSIFNVVKEKIIRDDLSMRGLLQAVPARKTLEWEGNPAVFCNVNYKENLV